MIATAFDGIVPPVTVKVFGVPLTNLPVTPRLLRLSMTRTGAMGV